MRCLALSVALVAAAPCAWADTVTLTAVADATIYSNEEALLANGSGGSLFAGNNSNLNTRRALVRFDLSQVPAGATVTGATLYLHLAQSIAGPQSVHLHRAARAWNEGPSAPLGSGGRGAPPQTGDSTWLHTSYDTAFWSAPGGDFDATPSASAVVGDDIVDYTWSGAGLSADIQGWVADPASNLGWFVLGEESGPTTAKRFDARESAAQAARPRLVVTYTAPAACYANCDGSTIPPVLNVLDFNCFLNRFSAGASYANCDGSTIAPVLNVLDFNCFLNAFAAGCP
jgi:hypothetical protein